MMFLAPSLYFTQMLFTVNAGFVTFSKSSQPAGPSLNQAVGIICQGYAVFVWQ